MTLRTFAFGALGALVLSAAAVAAPAFPKVSVMADGRTLVDGREVSPTELEQRFARLEKEGGQFAYYQENISQPASPAQSAARNRILMAVVQHSLKLTLYMNPDFSDAKPSASPGDAK